MSHDAVKFLLQSRNKPSEIRSGNWLFRLAWLLPFCSVLFAQLPKCEARILPEILYTMALGGCTIGLLMSILIPLAKRIAGNASLHSSLLKSNSHADLFMSGVQPSQLVDGITRHNLPAVRPWVGITTILAYLLGTGIFVSQMNLESGEPWNEAVLSGFTPALAGLMFFVLCLVGTVWASYVAQWKQVSSHFSARWTNLILFVVLSGTSAALYNADSVEQFLSISLGVYVGTLFASRFLLVRELTRINLEGDSSKRASFREGPPNAWLLRESDNPIVFRHSLQHARRTGGGFVRALLSRFPLALVLLGFTAFCNYDVAELTCVFGALICVQFIRTAVSAGAAVSSEFEHRTLEALTCTRTNNELFYRGWAEVVLKPLTVENGLLGVLLLAGIVKVGVPAELLTNLGLAAAAGLYLQFASAMAFRLGFYCSCQSSSKTSQSRLFEHLLAIFVLIPTVNFYIAGAVGVVCRHSPICYPMMLLSVLLTSAAGLAGIGRFYHNRAMLWLNTDHGRDVSGVDSNDKSARARN
jgi:hypothetical protein